MTANITELNLILKMPVLSGQDEEIQVIPGKHNVFFATYTFDIWYKCEK